MLPRIGSGWSLFWSAVLFLLFDCVTAQAMEMKNGLQAAIYELAAVDLILADSFEDPPSVVVNSTADADDTLSGDGKCDTGNTIIGGAPECTLRAAIQEVNSDSKIKLVLFAIPGAAPHVIQLTRPLPTITRDSAMLRGPALVAGIPQVVIDGSAGGGHNGLVVDALAVYIAGLGIQGFNSDGITLEALGSLTLSSVHISGNCGFGVYAKGRLRLDGAAGDPSMVEDNGNGIGCEGGGIFSASEPVRIINSTIRNNNGPGIFSHGAVWLATTNIENNVGPGLATATESTLQNVTIQRNRGQGIYVYNPGGSFSDLPSVRASAGVNLISGNLGHGIVAELGKLVVDKGVDLNVRDSAGWGIVIQAGVVELGVSEVDIGVSRIISGNGFEDECFVWVYENATSSIVPDPLHSGNCPGGGVYSAGLRTATSFFDAATISGNNGPGILTSARVNLSRSTISENESTGIRVVDSNNAVSGEDLMVYSSLGPNELFSNQGYGIHVETGSVELEESLSMEFNKGHGILLEKGNVDMLQSSGDAEKTIIQHGPGGGCRLWNITPPDLWTWVPSNCSSGGILAMDGNISGRLMIIRTNIGDGLNASGNMTLIDSTVCDNTGNQIVTGGSESLTDVITVCN